MAYYKYLDEYSAIAGGFTYLEVENGWALRQITINGTDSLASNRKHPRWGFDLPEGQIDYTMIEEVTEITKEEFDTIWNAHLAQRANEWILIKARNPLGASLQGYIELFFPQGLIIFLDQDVFGVADYQECQASTQPGYMYPRHKVTGVVRGYDEQNQWIIVRFPCVYAEKVRIDEEDMGENGAG